MSMRCATSSSTRRSSVLLLTSRLHSSKCWRLDHCGTLGKIPHQVFNCRAGPIHVEREPLVRHGHVDDSPRLQHPKQVLNGQERILAVFDEMVGNHEVLRAVSDRAEQFAVVDDVCFNERLSGQFDILAAKIRRRHPDRRTSRAPMKEPPAVDAGLQFRCPRREGTPPRPLHAFRGWFSTSCRAGESERRAASRNRCEGNRHLDGATSSSE